MWAFVVSEFVCSQQYESDFAISQYIFLLTLDGLTVSLSSLSTTSLTVLWTLVEGHNATIFNMSEGLNATIFTISYSNTNTDCFSDSSTISGIAGNETMFTLTGLEEGTEYSITLTATASGGTRENGTTATTETAG